MFRKTNIREPVFISFDSDGMKGSKFLNANFMDVKEYLMYKIH
jgi:hypothetical protein